MLNLYELHKNPEKLDKFLEYNILLHKFIGSQYNYNFEPIRHIIKCSPQYAFEYALNILVGRWVEAESVIMKDEMCAYYYAAHIIKGRWIEAEKYIMKNSYWGYEYATHVIKDRWHEAEPIIMKNPWHAVSYATDVIKDRWIEAEPYIMESERWWGYYCREFNIC